MIPALLINLDRSPDRLAAMREEFARVSVAFTRFTGVDTRNFTPQEFEEFFAPRAFSAQRLPGDAGNFLSHLGVWRTIAAGKDNLVAVFEDDVHLASDVPALLTSTAWIPPDADVVRLEANSKMVLKEGKRIDVAPRRKVYRAATGTWGTAGYIITKAAAAKLAEQPIQTHTHIDWFMFKPTRSPVAASLSRYQVYPAVCIQDDFFKGDHSAFKSLVSHGVRRPKAHNRRSLMSMILPNRKRPVPFVP